MQRLLCSAFLSTILLVMLSQQAGAGYSSTAERSTVLAIHPYLPEAEIRKRYQPLADYLQDVLESKVVVRVAKDYEEHIAAVGIDKFDIAFLGPAGYVRLVQKYGRKPLLARIETRGKPVFNGYLVSRHGSGISNIASLRGKRFAFGDPESTMSHLIPRHMLLTSGIDMDELGKYDFLGSHTNVALAVLNGEYDAGAVKGEVLAAFWDRGLRAFAKSESFSEHVFVARSDVDPAFVRSVTQALYRLSETPRGRAILSGMQRGITGMAPARDEDYDNLREVLRSLGKL